MNAIDLDHSEVSSPEEKLANNIESLKLQVEKYGDIFLRFLAIASEDSDPKLYSPAHLKTLDLSFLNYLSLADNVKTKIIFGAAIELKMPNELLTLYYNINQISVKIMFKHDITREENTYKRKLIVNIFINDTDSAITFFLDQDKWIMMSDSQLSSYLSAGIDALYKSSKLLGAKEFDFHKFSQKNQDNHSKANETLQDMSPITDEHLVHIDNRLAILTIEDIVSWVDFTTKMPNNFVFSPNSEIKYDCVVSQLDNDPSKTLVMFNSRDGRTSYKYFPVEIISKSGNLLGYKIVQVFEVKEDSFSNIAAVGMYDFFDFFIPE